MKKLVAGIFALALVVLLPSLAAAQPAGWDCATRSQDMGVRCAVDAGCWEGYWGTCQSKLQIGGEPIGGADGSTATPEADPIFTIVCKCVASGGQATASLSRTQTFAAGGLLGLVGLVPLLRRRQDDGLPH